MATKSKILKNFFKKFFNVDAVGMTQTAVLKDFFKKHYNIDADGTSPISVISDVIEENDSLPSGGGSDINPCDITWQLRDVCEENNEVFTSGYPYDSSSGPITLSLTNNLTYNDCENVFPATVIVTYDAHDENWGHLYCYVGNYLAKTSVSIELDTEEPWAVIGEVTVIDTTTGEEIDCNIEDY